MPKDAITKLETPPIISDEPVTSGEVAFQFDVYANTFARIIASIGTETPLTVGIHGAWGTGKTTLLKAIKTKLDETRKVRSSEDFAAVSFLNEEDDPTDFRVCKTVWFNVWKYAREEEALVALVSAILKEMTGGSFFERLIKELNDPEANRYDLLGMFLGAFSLKSPIVEFNIDPSKYKQETPFKSNVAFFDHFDAAFDDLVYKWLHNSLRSKRPEKRSNTDQGPILVVLIDDLDRCLPDKTVQVLEAIKLMVGRPGIVFIIAADRLIVQAAVEAHYERMKLKEISSQEYLNKIIQVKFDLPPIRQQDMGQFIERLSGLDKPLRRHLHVIAEGIPTNPRLVKTFINDLNLRWGFLVNSPDVDLAEIDREQLRERFIEWMVLTAAAPELHTFLAQMESKARATLLRDLIAVLRGEEQASSSIETKQWARQLEGHRQLKQVLGEGKFVFEANLLDMFIHHQSPPLEVSTVSEQPEYSFYEMETIRTLDVSELSAIVADVKAGMNIRQAAAERLSSLGDPRLGESVKVVGTDTIAAFLIDKYPVTNSQFADFLADNKDQKPPAHWNGRHPPMGKENHPVVNVDWEQAMNYAEWLGKRLPTADEWRLAAGGSDHYLYPWGDDWRQDAANTREKGILDTTPVGMFPAGASPCGALDMAGQVWEWVSDSPEENSQLKFICGGSYQEGREQAQTIYERSLAFTTSNDRVGFRCVKSLPDAG